MNIAINQFHLGIYAVIENEDNILLVKKSRGPYEGMWDLPGGRPQHGETIFETLKREVKEETGIDILNATIFKNDVVMIHYHQNGQSIYLHHTCLIYKVCDYQDTQFQANIIEEDVRGCSWIKKSKLSDVSLSPIVKLLVTR